MGWKEGEREGGGEMRGLLFFGNCFRDPPFCYIDPPPQKASKRRRFAASRVVKWFLRVDDLLYVGIVLVRGFFG